MGKLRVNAREATLWKPATYRHSRILVEVGKIQDDGGAGLLSQPNDYTNDCPETFGQIEILAGQKDCKVTKRTLFVIIGNCSMGLSLG